MNRKKPSVDETLGQIAALEARGKVLSRELNLLAARIGAALLAKQREGTPEAAKNLADLRVESAEKQAEEQRIAVQVHELKGTLDADLNLIFNLPSEKRWAECSRLAAEILEHGENYEKLQSKAGIELNALREKAKRALAIVPETDGTDPRDSVLADARLIEYGKLEIRRHGLPVAPYFRHPEPIPPFTARIQEAVGWLIKRRPRDL